MNVNEQEEEEPRASLERAETGSRRDTEQGEGDRMPPGPASSKTRYQTRARSESLPRVSLRRLEVSTAITAERRSRREAAHEANRLAGTSTGEQGEEEPPICIDSEDSDESHSPDRGGLPLKRKMAEDEDGSGSQEATRRKQGRPQTTGYYVGRREAQEELNRAKKEAVELEERSTLNNRPTDQVFTKEERDLEDVVEKLENTPTADVAQKGRTCMAEVLKVAKGSRNLKGDYVRILKQATVMGTASMEVLRTRADCGEADSDALRQIKALRRELDDTKREARIAREEAEALRAELAEAKAQASRGSGRQRGRVIEDDKDSPTPSPIRTRGSKARAEKVNATEDAAMEIDDAGAKVPETPEYDDVRRKKEILPPREEWPPAIRPAIQGKAKILEDRTLTECTVKVVDGDKRPTTRRSAVSDQRGEVQSFMDQITPLLEKWLREHLSIGLPTGKNSGEKKKETRPTDKGNKGERRANILTPLEKKKPINPGANNKGGAHPTTVPSTELFSAVAGKMAKDNTLHTPATRQQDAPNHPQDTQATSESWTEVTKKGAKKKKPSSVAKQQPPATQNQRGLQTREKTQQPVRTAQKGKDPKSRVRLSRDKDHQGQRRSR